ncbi:AbiH family protein [Maribacter sp.]|uniref:AbiH family protein n=1 Tax=Maribacter sp. TaxID=1897614 RepID=UPI0025B80A73|nr:AbiH family protein [Maribacter sp.]
MAKNGQMNRLVLLGNGFDLAHGLKTSYKDFIFDYFKKAIIIFHEKDSYEDQLFELSYASSYMFTSDFELIINNFDDIREHIKNLKSSKISSMVKVNVIFHSPFFEFLYTKLTDLNWVDIEASYFQYLIIIKEKKEAVEKLNSQFTFIGIKLNEYLISLKISEVNFFGKVYSNLFSQKIIRDDIVINTLDQDLDPAAIYFLNFNYTDTVGNYLKNISNQDIVKHNYIHGELEVKENPIIFGFGDELDENYLKFENKKNNSLFTHIKSFKYSQTQNYHDLIRFIESNDFQVFVIGHSCGLSDRTMLNEIFEHDNCKSIKIFYHKRADGSDDFTDKTYEISRHFKDKGLMRKKLVPKEKSQPMPKPRKIG